MHTVLIVEDEKTLRDALRTQFTQEGFEVVEAENGEEGVQMAMVKDPDVILLDVKMPSVDGMAMLERLQSQSMEKQPYVLILSNNGSVEKTAEAMQYGVFDYFVKADHSLEEIVAQVKRHLAEDETN